MPCSIFYSDIGTELFFDVEVRSEGRLLLAKVRTGRAFLWRDLIDSRYAFWIHR